MTETGEQDRQLARIRGLLAKAESTEFAEEAESLYAKAQELMTRFAIDDAALAGARETEDNPIRVVEVSVWTPYPNERCVILSSIARANDCRTVVSSKIGAWTVKLVGFARDLERAELLYTSLSMHASREMKRADKCGESPQRFYRSFLVAFGARLGDRLMDARSAVAEGDDLLPVLYDRSQLVNDRLGEMFPNLRAGRPVLARSEVGWSAGERAANNADLGQTRVRGQEAIR